MVREINERNVHETAMLIKELSSSPDIVVNIYELKEKINEINRNKNVLLFGFEEEDKIVGMFTLGIVQGITYNFKSFAVIENVVVRSTFRNRGIGKKMINHAIELARRLNCYKIILETSSKEGWKHLFYENCGLLKGEKTAFIKRFG